MSAGEEDVRRRKKGHPLGQEAAPFQKSTYFICYSERKLYIYSHPIIIKPL